MEQAIISGVTHDTSEAKVTIRDVPDRPGVAAEVFAQLAEANVNVDMIIQNVSEDGHDRHLVHRRPRTTSSARGARSTTRGRGARRARRGRVDESIAKVSLVGAGMKTHPGVAAEMFRALADAGVNLDMISTSPIRISCVIGADQVADAVRALHAAFGLDDDEVTAEVSPGVRRRGVRRWPGTSRCPSGPSSRSPEPPAPSAARCCSTLEQRAFPAVAVVALASSRSAGKRLPFAGGELAVEEMTPASFEGVDIALFSAGAGVSKADARGRRRAPAAS